jgi:arylsulfatase A
MNPRMNPFLRILCALIASIAPLRAAEPPNIVFIITDDLGYGDLSCYGQTHFQTPHLDRMAQQGLRFTDHYAGATVCAPSRCALMTGKDTGHSYIRGNGPFALRPDPEDLTVATLLRQNGYSTGLIGKSCVTGNTQTPETLTAKGFSYFYGTTDHQDGHFRYPEFVYENDKRIELSGNTRYAGPHYDLDLYTGKALEFIGRQGKKPFFLLLSYPLPHASLAAPEDSVAKVRAGIQNDISHNPSKGHYGKVAEVKATYAAMVTRIDDAVGSLLDKLKQQGVDENTLIIFTSDNGSHIEGGYHHSLLQSNGKLRGGKRDLYEGGIRIPFIARWPKGVPGGRTTDHPSAFWDFLPTVCELAGIPKPSDIQGISYAPTLFGKADQQASHESLYWEFHELQGRRALRMGDWKLVQYGLMPGAFGEPELYDLANDPSETKDLATQEPARLKAMLSRIKQSRRPSPDFPLKGLDGN